MWLVSTFVLLALIAVVVLYRVGYDSLPEALQLDDISSYVAAVLIGGLVVAFLLYLMDMEVRLRRLSGMLVEERVLSAALSNRLSEISALSEVGKAINTTLDLADVLTLILSSALELLGGTEGSIMLVEEDGEGLRVVSYQGPNYEKVMGRRGVIGVGIAGGVARARQPILLQKSDFERELKDQGHPERGINSAMCVPLVRNEEVLGVLNVNETQSDRSFTEHDLDALGLFAEHAAIAIGNARLYEKERDTVVRLEELDRLKSDFVASVSHELRTPLTAIIGAAKTVSKRAATMPAEQRANLLEMIERQGNLLLRLVEDVLTAAQIESGRPRFTRELIDLRELIDDVVGKLAQTKVGKDRTIRVECQPEKPRTWGDVLGLQHTVLNLVENALKYSDDDKEVVVRAIETADEARLEVSDQGRGISQGEVDSIFERFRQIDSSSTRSVGGFGLGLFIVKNLVDAHGGEITVTSVPGQGSTFVVTLPKRATDRGELLPGG